MPENERERIAAVVVTYNRKRLLGECLDSLLRQGCPLDGLYIIDNHSTDGTYEYLLGREMIAPIERTDEQASETLRRVPMPGSSQPLDVHYVRMAGNTGGAGGFHEGVKRAAGADFDWLWLMDDDLLTAPDALEVLVRKKDGLAAAGERSFILNSVVLAKGADDADRLAFPLQELSSRGLPRFRTYHWRLSEVRGLARDGLYRWACPFNGTFIPARIATEVGLPNKDFFIYGDEMDFLWRAARTFSLYTALDSRVFHPQPRPQQFDWKQYYLTRNMMVVNRHFSFPALRNARLIVLSLVKGLRHGPGGLALVLRGIKDGLTGRLGKRDDIHP